VQSFATLCIGHSSARERVSCIPACFQISPHVPDLQSFVTRAAHTPAPSLDNGALHRDRAASNDVSVAAADISSAPVSYGAPAAAAPAAAAQPPPSLLGDLLDLDVSGPATTPAPSPLTPAPAEGASPSDPTVNPKVLQNLGLTVKCVLVRPRCRRSPVQI
jgi:hypothetical protein